MHGAGDRHRPVHSGPMRAHYLPEYLLPQKTNWIAEQNEKYF
jgi:hypothetical protein